MSVQAGAALLAAASAMLLLLNMRRRRCQPPLQTCEGARGSTACCELPTLPHDVLELVLMHAPEGVLAVACRVSKAWALASDSDTMWRARASRKFWKELRWNERSTAHGAPYTPREHDGSAFADALRRGTERRVDAYHTGSLELWRVGWKGRNVLDWDMVSENEAHRAALMRDYEFRLDVLFQAHRSSSRFRQSMQHMFGHAPIQLPERPKPDECAALSVKCDFPFGSLVTPSGEALAHAAQMTNANLEIFPGEESTGALVINIFARRRSDGRVSHVLHLLSIDLDEVLRRSEDPQFSPFGHLGNHVVRFTCAPPRVFSVPPTARARHKGVAWLAEARFLEHREQSGGEGGASLRFDLGFHDYPEEPSQRMLGTATFIEWIALRELLHDGSLLDWVR